jgi:hypothetical protein
MKKEYFLFIIVIVIVISAIILRILPYKLSVPKIEVPKIELPATSTSPEIIPPVSSVASTSPEILLPTASTSPEVIMKNPIPGMLVSSPLTVEGRARGGWFFEATLPVKLIAQNGDIILASYGKAQSDWMTTDLVPFVSVLEFTTTATSGHVVISKDNPSGLPEYDASILIPVLFQ